MFSANRRRTFRGTIDWYPSELLVRTQDFLVRLVELRKKKQGILGKEVADPHDYALLFCNQERDSLFLLIKPYFYQI